MQALVGMSSLPSPQHGLWTKGNNGKKDNCVLLCTLVHALKCWSSNKIWLRWLSGMLWSPHTNAPAVRAKMVGSESTAKRTVHPIVHMCASFHTLQIKMYWVYKKVDKIAKGANACSIVRSGIKVNGGRENFYSLHTKAIAGPSSQS